MDLKWKITTYRIVDGLVQIIEDGKPVSYSKTSLIKCIANLRKNRNMFATEEAYNLRMKILTDALAFLKGQEVK